MFRVFRMLGVEGAGYLLCLVCWVFTVFGVLGV